MKLLILTQYFPPEVGAPQNRLYELGIRLAKSGIQVDALTAMPNYPQMKIHKEYKNKFFFKEQLNDITVFRSFIYTSKSKGIASRLLNYFSFVFSSLLYGIFKLPSYDVILCESPPLFLGITGKILSSLKKSKFIFNVSDLWPESAEKLGIVTNKRVLRIATILEEMLYKNSDLITGQTQGIVDDIKGRFPSKKVYWLPNGVDVSYYNPSLIKSDWRVRNSFKEDDLLLLYAGILGYAQGLEVVLKSANITKENKKIRYILLGSGPEKDRLIQINKELGLKNVYFFDGVPKSEMAFIIKAIDIALVPLRKLPLFEGAIPSKIFENLAMNKPLLLGVEGEAHKLFIEDGKTGLGFEPENAEDLALKCQELFNSPDLLDKFAHNAREYVSKNFNRNDIAEKFQKKLLEL
tara:strand:- start:662 stop:1882 length:1221 start_codon:yes stop_codon:yes gene_type:complete